MGAGDENSGWSGGPLVEEGGGGGVWGGAVHYESCPGRLRAAGETTH